MPSQAYAWPHWGKVARGMRRLGARFFTFSQPVDTSDMGQPIRTNHALRTKCQPWRRGYLADLIPILVATDITVDGTPRSSSVSL